MSKKDLAAILAIGGAVGLLVQPVLSNVSAVGYLSAHVGLSELLVRIIVFLIFFVGAPAALWIAIRLSQAVPVVYQIAKFAAVGTLNSCIDLGLFNLMAISLGAPLGGTVKFIVFKTTSFLAATTNSFFWNKGWTFSDQSQAGAGKVVKFYVITGMNWLVNVGVATLVSRIQPGNAVWVSLVAPVCGILAGMVGNFLSYKFLVFKVPAQS